MNKKEIKKLKSLAKRLEKLAEKCDRFVDVNWAASAHNDEIHHKCHQKMGEAKGYVAAATELNLVIIKLEGE